MMPETVLSLAKTAMDQLEHIPFGDAHNILQANLSQLLNMSC